MTINKDTVFGGGGVKGFCHIGYLFGARKVGVNVRSALGVSVGSLIATLVMNGRRPEEIQEIFSERLRKSITKAAMNYAPDVTAVKLLYAALGWHSQLVKDAFTAEGTPGTRPIKFEGDLSVVRAKLIDETSFYPDLFPAMREMVDELKLKPVRGLRVLAYDIVERRHVLFDHTTADLALALTASCALPGAFRPVPHPNGKGLLVDGAWYHRNPGDFSRRGSIIVKLNKATALPQEMLSPIDFMGHMKEMMGLSAFHRDEVAPSQGHTVVEMNTPHVAGLSFGICSATQQELIDIGRETTIKTLRAARKNGSL